MQRRHGENISKGVEETLRDTRISSKAMIIMNRFVNDIFERTSREIQTRRMNQRLCERQQ